MDRSYLSVIDPLEVEFSVNKTSLKTNEPVTLSAKISGGDTSQTALTTFYCDRSDDTTEVNPIPVDPKDGMQGAPQSGENTISQSTTCNYSSAGNKMVKVIIQRGSDAVEVKIPLEVKAPTNYKYSFYCSSTDDSLTSGGANGLPPALTMATTKTLPCTYPVQGEYWAKVVVTDADNSQSPGFAARKKIQAAPANSNPVPSPVVTITPSPFTPTPATPQNNVGESFNYGDGSGSW